MSSKGRRMEQWVKILARRSEKDLRKRRVKEPSPKIKTKRRPEPVDVDTLLDWINKVQDCRF